MYLHDFTYQLPQELIATHPLPQRSASRLLLLDGSTIQHQQFNNLPQLITKNDLLVFNSSKVMPARLRGNKLSGGKIEILVERIINNNQCLAHVRANNPLKLNSCFMCAGEEIHVIAQHKQLFTLALNHPNDWLSFIQKNGEIPLPPYFKRLPNAMDQTRYQNIYAQELGSVAAPTAGLHFDQNLIDQLHSQGTAMAFITLHVGSGTFLPVRTQDITQHQLHHEHVAVSAQVCDQINTTKKRGGKIIAVGTTTARSLETASQTGQIKPYYGDSNLFIYPGYQFKCIDAMITNFHLPESSLLMLVCALGGYQAVMHAYKIAITQKYRFYSYGDAMLLYNNHSQPSVGSL